jgi:hypothetical protein
MKVVNSILAASLMIISLGSSCRNKEPVKKTTSMALPKTVVMEPFRFHKAIEVKPGLTLDVLSWGRGSETDGAYMVLRSDSTHMKYKSTSGELDGKIVDAWNMDLDSDGNPELFIQSKGEGEGSHLNMYVYEYSDGGSAQELNFPSLKGSQKEGYKGQDSVYIKEGILMRSFPVFDEGDSTNTPTNEKKTLIYKLRNNSFQVSTEEKK